MAEDKTTLKDLIQQIDFRLTHLEDIRADNRTLIVKLVKQGNTVVEFLKQFDVAAEHPSMGDDFFDLKTEEVDVDRIKNVDELVAEFVDKTKDLREFEEELKKHKNKITPGQIGEA